MQIAILLFHLPFPGFLFSCVLRRPCPLSLCTPRHHHHGCRHPTLLAAHSLSSGAALAGEGWIGWVGVGIKYSKPLVCICKHTATRIRIYGGAAQLEVGSITVSVSWPSALHCHPCLTHCSPGNVPNPTPLMSTPLVKTGQPTI